MKQDNSFNWDKVKDFKTGELVLATIIPGIIAFTGFHIVIPGLVDNNMPVLLAYGLVASTMLFLFLITSIFFIYRESKLLSISIFKRMLIKGIGKKNILLSIVIFIITTLGAVLIKPVSATLISVLEYKVPNYLPYFLNPLIDPSSADVMVLSSGTNLIGRWDILFFLILTIILNILTEEIYFRAWMLPKLKRFGKYTWLVNGFLFALYHIYQLWLFPVILIPSLGFAYICNRSKSVIPAFILHLVMNSLTVAGLFLLFI